MLFSLKIKTLSWGYSLNETKLSCEDVYCNVTVFNSEKGFRPRERWWRRASQSNDVFLGSREPTIGDIAQRETLSP